MLGLRRAEPGIEGCVSRMSRSFTWFAKLNTVHKVGGDAGFALIRQSPNMHAGGGLPLGHRSS